MSKPDADNSKNQGVGPNQGGGLPGDLLAPLLPAGEPAPRPPAEPGTSGRRWRKIGVPY